MDEEDANFKEEDFIDYVKLLGERRKKTQMGRVPNR
jgi:hypothetical protein